MVSVKEEDRDSLRFLWVENPNEDSPEILTLRFTRVVFGASSSPFFLNATINHHMERYRQLDPIFVDRFLSSIYVDDLVSGSKDLESTFTNYDSHLLDSSLGNLRPTRKTYVVGSGRVSHHHQKLGEQTRSHTTMKTNHMPRAHWRSRRKMNQEPTRYLACSGMLIGISSSSISGT